MIRLAMVSLTSLILLAGASIALAWAALAPSQLMARFAVMAREAVIGSYSRLMLITVLTGLVVCARWAFATPDTQVIDTTNTPWDPIAILVFIMADTARSANIWPAALQALAVTLAVIWGLGVAFRLVQLGRSLREGYNMAGQAKLLTSPGFSASIEEALETRKVRILVSTDQISPFTVGHVRPAILIPEMLLADDSREHLEPVIAHELAHIVRADFAKNLLLRLLTSLLWINPPFQRLADGYGVGVEMACDRQTLDFGVSRAALARAIDFLGRCHVDQKLAPAFLGGGREAHLRVKALSKSVTPKHWAVSLTNAVALFATLLLVSAAVFTLHKIDQSLLLSQHRSALVEDPARFNLMHFQSSVRDILLVELDETTLSATLEVSPTQMTVDGVPVSLANAETIRSIMIGKGVLPDAAYRLEFEGPIARFSALGATPEAIEQVIDPNLRAQMAARDGVAGSIS